jgi:hypothetical protein
VNNTTKTNYGQPLPKTSIENNFRRYHWSTKKYHDETKPATTTDGYANILYHRFAETLLLSAEAHWRLCGSNSDPLALKYINMIRERAYGSSDKNIKSFDLETYLEKDAREMAMEKTRWFLLKRLGILQERVNKYFTFGSNTSNTIRRQMTEKMVRLPIPQSEIDLMGSFPQNSGY